MEGNPIAIIPERATLMVGGDGRPEMVERFVDKAVSSVSVDGQPSEVSWLATAWQADGQLTHEQYGINGDGD